MSEAPIIDSRPKIMTSSLWRVGDTQGLFYLFISFIFPETYKMIFHPYETRETKGGGGTKKISEILKKTGLMCCQSIEIKINLTWSCIFC